MELGGTALGERREHTISMLPPDSMVSERELKREGHIHGNDGVT